MKLSTESPETLSDFNRHTSPWTSEQLSDNKMLTNVLRHLSLFRPLICFKKIIFISFKFYSIPDLVEAVHIFIFKISLCA